MVDPAGAVGVAAALCVVEVPEAAEVEASVCPAAAGADAATS
jgi:hypothetical protein